MGRRSVGAWLGLVLLLAEILVGGALPLVPGKSVAQALGDDHVWVCTTAGMVELGADGVPLDSGQAGHQRLCAFCLPVFGGGFGHAPELATLPARLAASLASPPPPATVPAAVPATLAGRSSPRAPPFA